MNIYPSLQGRAIIITGGGRGLGRVMALALAAQGARLLLTGTQGAEALERTAMEARAAGAEACETLLADVADADACQSVADRALAAFDRIDGLINNAGISGSTAAPERGKPFPFYKAHPEKVRRLVETNFLGPLFMAQAVIPTMLAQGFGRIVNISTSRPTMIGRGNAPYGPVKAGLEASSVIWARELDGSGITVNVLLPGGAADTEFIVNGVVGERADRGMRPGKDPIGREGDTSNGLIPPEVMAAPICWLCADESAATTGRRVVARDWDPDLPGEQAAARAMTPAQSPPLAM